MNLTEQLREILADTRIPLYQTHTWEGKRLNEGLRGIERRSLIDISDIKGKDVLDLGCATGAECIWAYEQGANFIVGVEQGEKQVETFRELISTIGASNIHSLHHDLKQGVPLLTFSVDTLFCFSITHHLGYKKIWNDVPGVKVVYVEGGADSNYSEGNLTDDLFEAKLIGYVENHSKDLEKRRPLFKLTRKPGV